MLVVVVYIKEASERAYGVMFLVGVIGVRFKISMISKYHVLILRGIYLDQNQPHYNHFLLPVLQHIYILYLRLAYYRHHYNYIKDTLWYRELRYR